jgi:hypothetical protein
MIMNETIIDKERIETHIIPRLEKKLKRALAQNDFISSASIKSKIEAIEEYLSTNNIDYIKDIKECQ